MADPKKIKIKAKNKGGKEGEVEITIDEQKATGTIKVGKDENELTGLSRSKDGKKVCGKADVPLNPVDATVTITINCDEEPPSIKIVATKAGAKLKDDKFTFTHEEQDRLVDWIKKLTIPVLAAPAKVFHSFGAQPGLFGALSEIRRLLLDADRSFRKQADDWSTSKEAFELVTGSGLGTIALTTLWAEQRHGDLVLEHPIAVRLAINSSIPSIHDSLAVPRFPLRPEQLMPRLRLPPESDREGATHVAVRRLIEARTGRIEQALRQAQTLAIDEALIRETWREHRPLVGQMLRDLASPLMPAKAPPRRDDDDEPDPPLDWWSIVHFCSGLLLGLICFDFETTLLLLIWWEIIEPHIWPGWNESPENQIVDIIVGMLGWILGKQLKGDRLIDAPAQQRPRRVKRPAKA